MYVFCGEGIEVVVVCKFVVGVDGLVVSEEGYVWLVINNLFNYMVVWIVVVVDKVGNVVSSCVNDYVLVEVY